jgi:hypothetical protein
MTWSQQGHEFALDSLQRKAQWHLAASEWDNYLATVQQIVAMYDIDTTSAQTVAELLQEQGQDISQWVALIEYANQQLIGALDTARGQIDDLRQDEQNRAEHHRQLSNSRR